MRRTAMSGRPRSRIWPSRPAGTLIANEVGDDAAAAALAARRRLAPLPEKIQDPLLHAVCQLARAWTSPTTGDSGGALREASVSPGQLRGQDKPLLHCPGRVHRRPRGDGPGPPRRRPTTPARDTRPGGSLRQGLAHATSRVQPGTLAVVQGRPDQARELLDEALDMSLAIRHTRNVTMCLAALARLAFAEGDPSRRRCQPGRRGPARAGRAAHVPGPTAGKGRADGPGPPRRWGPTGSPGVRRRSGLSQREAVAAIGDRPGDGTQSS
jgi:hypothetical protein